MIKHLIIFFIILISPTSSSSSSFSCSSTDLPAKTSASSTVISGRLAEVVTKKYITYVYYRLDNVEVLKGSKNWEDEVLVGRFASEVDAESCVGPLQPLNSHRIFFLSSTTPITDPLFNTSVFHISSFPVEASPLHLQMIALQQSDPSKLVCNDVICQNGGSCRFSGAHNKAMCFCREGFYGEECQLHSRVMRMRADKLSDPNSMTSVLIIIMTITIVVYFVSLLLFTVFKRCARNESNYHVNNQAQMKGEKMSFLMEKSYTAVEDQNRNKNEEKNIIKTSNKETFSIEDEGVTNNDAMGHAIKNLFDYDSQPRIIPEQNTQDYIVNLTRTSSLYRSHPTPNSSIQNQQIPQISIHSPATNRSNSAPKEEKRFSNPSPHSPKPPISIIRPKTYQNKQRPLTEEEIKERKLSLPSRKRLYASSSTPDNSMSRRTIHAVKTSPSYESRWDNIGIRMASAKQESRV